MYDYVIIGGGILGLATAMAVGNKYSGASTLVLENEPDLAQHQTGRNSGVIHSAIYYQPGSLKARFAREGNRSTVEFCCEHGIKHEVCGKVIVATKASELRLLDSLFQRGLDHGLAVARLAPEQVKGIEPHVRCLAGIKVLSTGIVNYREVSAKYVELIESQGGTVQTGTRVDRLRDANGIQVIINCAGLFSDRTRSGVRAQALMPDGKLVDDFLIVKEKNSIHVCNAPSPGATASLEIGRFIANQLPDVTLARR
jgi:L-2-hydroxyglutarate oxidase